MRALILLSLTLVSIPSLFAQKKTFVTVRAGNNIMDILPTAEVFYYPVFTTGKVFLRGGTMTEARLNYNRLVDEMHFISPGGDTLALADEKNVKHVIISKDTFYYDQGYLRLLAGGDGVKLAIKQNWIISDSRQIGALNSTNSSVSITSFKSYNESGRLYDLTVNEDLILKKIEQYYFGDSNNYFVLASKKNLLLLFPKEQEGLEKYLKENKMNFSSKDDLEKIVRFLQHK